MTRDHAKSQKLAHRGLDGAKYDYKSNCIDQPWAGLRHIVIVRMLTLANGEPTGVNWSSSAECADAGEHPSRQWHTSGCRDSRAAALALIAPRCCCWWLVAHTHTRHTVLICSSHCAHALCARSVTHRQRAGASSIGGAVRCRDAAETDGAGHRFGLDINTCIRVCIVARYHVVSSGTHVRTHARSQAPARDWLRLMTGKCCRMIVIGGLRVRVCVCRSK